MSVAFWSTKVTSGKPAQVQPPEGYVLNVQQASVVNGSEKASYLVHVETLAIEGDKLEAVIGTLRPGKTDQFPCSIVFGYDVPTTFSVTVNGDKGDGKAAVYLSGYFQPAPDDGKHILRSRRIVYRGISNDWTCLLFVDGDDEDMMDYDDEMDEDDEDEDDDEDTEEDEDEEPRVVELDDENKPKNGKQVPAIKNEAKPTKPADNKPAAAKPAAAQKNAPVQKIKEESESEDDDEEDDDDDEDDEDDEVDIKVSFLVATGVFCLTLPLFLSSHFFLEKREKAKAGLIKTSLRHCACALFPLTVTNPSLFPLSFVQM